MPCTISSRGCTEIRTRTTAIAKQYLGSIIDGSGGCGKDIDGLIKVAWSRWRDLSGVIYDKKVPVKLKSKLYKIVVRHAMVYGSERWALRKQEEQRLHTTDMKLLRWIGKTKLKMRPSGELLQK